MGFLGGPARKTVNPSRWRQAQLTARHGPYEVTATTGRYLAAQNDCSWAAPLPGTEPAAEEQNEAVLGKPAKSSGYLT